MRITPEKLTVLNRNDVVLIGTNESGIHGAGIADHAYKNWGAVMGQGFGAMGQCFGLPTKDWEIVSLDPHIINQYVQRYIVWTQLRQNKKRTHYVTQVGCGLAGFTPEEIAPMFAECIDMKNIWLPESFIDVIGKPLTWKYIFITQVKSKNYASKAD